MRAAALLRYPETSQNFSSTRRERQTCERLAGTAPEEHGFNTFKLIARDIDAMAIELVRYLSRRFVLDGAHESPFREWFDMQ